MPEYEILKSFVSDEVFVVPRQLPPGKIANCKLVNRRETLLELLPTGGVAAEVGTDYGHFAKIILEIVKPDTLHIFDLSFSRFERKYFSEAILSGRVILHEGDSSTQLAKLRDDKAGWFDWVYIDADHSYEGVSRDIEQAKLLIKQDGLLIFNDYAIYSPFEKMQYGVMRAVNDLILDEGFEMAYYALNTLGYNDVAVRRQRR